MTIAMSEVRLLSPAVRPDDARSAPGTQSPPPKTAVPRRGAWGWPLVRILLIAAAGALAWIIANNWDRWNGASRFQRTDDAYLVGDLTPLAAKVSGYIANVRVQDFATVRQGDLLAEIDPSDYRAQLAQAQANRSTAAAALANLVNQRAIQRALLAPLTAGPIVLWRTQTSARSTIS